jgi:hypothetical protein
MNLIERLLTFMATQYSSAKSGFVIHRRKPQKITRPSLSLMHASDESQSPGLKYLD